MFDWTNGDRRNYLKSALKALRGYSYSPMGILGNMPEGLDSDIWDAMVKLEEMLEARIAHVETLDWDEEAPISKTA